MKVSEAIEKLNVGDTVWVKLKVLEKNDIRKTVCLKSSTSHGFIWTANDDELSLDEPKTDKVEVTEEQARFLKEHEGQTLFMLLIDCKSKEEELFARARLFGYTVKSKRWVVKMATGYFMDFEEGCNEEGFEWVSSSKSCCLVFTDKSKAEAVATLVEGSVEEV